MAIDKTLYDRLGGKQTYIKVHKIFYDKAYAHPWLSQYFADKPQEILENQQTDFMVQLMGDQKPMGVNHPSLHTSIWPSVTSYLNYGPAYCQIQFVRLEYLMLYGKNGLLQTEH